MSSSVTFTLCLAALVGSVSAVRRGADSVAFEAERGSTCCCFSDSGDCASKKVKQGQNIQTPSGAATYCCKLRSGSGCQYHKKKYGTPLAEILGETATVHDSACTYDVAAPPTSQTIPEEKPPKPPVEEPKDLNDPAPPVEDSTEDDLRAPSGYGAEGQTTPVTPEKEVKDGNDPAPPVEDTADETEDEQRSPAGYVAAGEKTPVTPAEELEDSNDPAPPVVQDTAVAETVDEGAAVGTPPVSPAVTTDARVTDLTDFMLDKKERTVDGTTYTCCCSVENNNLRCEVLDVNSPKEISWKSGCGGLKGNGWHSYNNMGKKYSTVTKIGKCLVETSELAEKLLIGHLMQ